MDNATPPLNPAKIEQLGLVLSRFSFDELPNQNYHAGAFELQVSSSHIPNALELQAQLRSSSMVCLV